MASPVTGLHLAPLTELIIGAFHDVVSELGCGYLEAVTRRALVIGLRDRGLLAETNISLGVKFRGQTIGLFYPDIVVERLVIIEVKATSTVEPWATAQLLNYLKCAGGGVGFVMNFGTRPEWKRRVQGYPEISLPLLPKDPVKDLSRWLATETRSSKTGAAKAVT